MENKNKITKIISAAKYLQYLSVFGFIFLHPLNGSFYPKLAAVIALFIIFSLFDIYRRIKNNKGFSPFALTALLFIFFFSYYAGIAPSDDHHFGEKFAAYFMHSVFNLEYYKDIMLVHGRMDITGAALGNFFFNENSVYSYFLGEMLHRNIIFILAIFTLLCIFNCNILYAAPALLLKTPSVSVFFAAVYVLMLKKSLFSKPAVLFWLYIIFALIFSVYWTTIGSFWAISALPLFIYAVIKLENRKKHLKAAGLLLLMLLIIFRNTAFEYFHQAEYYIKGTLYAFGNDFGSLPDILRNKMPIEAVFELLYKFSALLLAPVFILEIMRIISASSPRRLPAKKLLFLLFPVIFTFVSLTYTLGRLDNGLFLRLEYISAPVLCVIAPYWIYKYAKIKTKAKFDKIFALIFSGALIYSSIFLVPEKIKQMHTPQYISNTQLFNTGNIKLDLEHEKRLTEIKEFLYPDNKPAEKETFLDLTNRGMHYLYFNKKQPVQFSSFYNSIASKQAVESFDKIRKNPPDAILIFSDNIAHDYVFPSLRINYLYRQLFLKYKYEYKKAGSSVFLVKSDKTPEYTQGELDDLDYYLAASNLKYLPEVWALSINTLPVIKLKADYTMQNYGNEIKIRFNTPQRMQDYDLLYFNAGADKTDRALGFKISINGSKSEIKCLSKSGKLLIPLDNFPSWLLNSSVREITIKSDTVMSAGNSAFETAFYGRSINRTN